MVHSSVQNGRPRRCLVWASVVLAGLSAVLAAGGGAAYAALIGVNGDILGNPYFETWKDGALAAWEATESGAVTKGKPGPDGSPLVLLKRKKKPFVDMRQVIDDPPLLPGDTLYFEVRARCTTPDALNGLLRLYTADEQQDITRNIFHPGDGAWHTLTTVVSVPEAQVNNLTLGVRARKKLDTPAEIAYARAYLVPPLP